MSNVAKDLIAINERKTNKSYTIADSEAWFEETCQQCASPTMVAVMKSDAHDQQFLRCPVCLAGAVRTGGKLQPAASGLLNPNGQPQEDQYVWDEVRGCMTVGAFNAVVMLCRKLLLHLAIRGGLPAKDKGGRSPSFDRAVNYLASEGFVTARMRPWVDRIREVGNEANHELPQVTKDQATMIAQFTQQLLVMTYEYPAALGEATPAGEEEGEEETATA